MKKYEVVFLDLDDTLFDFKKAEREALIKAFVELKIDLTEKIAKAYEMINEIQWELLEKGETTIAKLKIERFDQLVSSENISANARDLSTIYIKWLSQGIFPLNDAIEVCKYLARNYRLCIISNGIKEVQYPRILNSEIGKFIERIVVSEEAKSSKPSKEIFEYACDLLSYYDKQKMIMIGDSIASDILGGHNFGIDTCWANLKMLKNSTSIVSTYEIRHLNELKKLL